MIQELRKSFLKHLVFFGIFGLLVFGNVFSVQAVERVCFDMQTNQEYDCSNPPPSSGQPSGPTAQAVDRVCIDMQTNQEYDCSSPPPSSGPPSGLDDGNDNSGGGNYNPGSGNDNPGSGNDNSGGGNYNPGPSGTLANPLKSDSIPAFLLKIIDVILVFALPLIIIYIMYAGFLLVTSQGNPSEIETARSALLWAVIGGVVILGARLIIEVIQGTIEAF